MESMNLFFYEEDRLATKGPEAVKDIALLGYVTGDDTKAEDILADHSFEKIVDMSVEQIAKLKGMTLAKARAMVSTIELTKRGLNKGIGSKKHVIGNPGDVLPFLYDIKDQQREHFVCLYLNARNQVIQKEVVSIGSLSSAIVHPREVFRLAISLPCASIMVAHNHPSGDVSPSQDDIDLTRRLVQAGEIMSIDVLDHLIIGSDDFLSMKERGLI